MSSELKYIKLFEAFESQKISKTLNFINDESKNTFMDLLKLIAEKIDFPISKFNDNFFQYLNFKKALNLNYNVGDEPCDATSESTFPEYSVPGKKCEGGKIVRKWGSSNRTVACPKCAGTGIKPKTNSEIKWIKFWFDKDGNFITTSVVDGIIRKSDYASSNISQYISDYEIVGPVTRSSDFLKYPSGTPIQITIDGKEMIAILYNKNNESYIIQNTSDGSAPSGSDWKKYGNFSWAVSHGDYRGTPIVLKSKNETQKDEMYVDPYDWNASIRIDRRNMSVVKDSGLKRKLEKAHFAIVLDFMELKGSMYKKKSLIKSEREESRTGASKLISDEEVKRLNFERYISKLAELKFEKKEDLLEIKNLKNLVMRLLGSNNLGFYILSDDFNLRSLYERLHQLITKAELGHDEEFNIKLREINNLVKSKLENISTKNNIINQQVRQCNKEFSSDENKSIFINQLREIAWNKIIELNQTIFNKVKNFELNNLEDLEILIEKLNSINRISNTSSRIGGYSLIRWNLCRIGGNYSNYPDRLFMDLYDEESFDNLTLSIDRLIKVIERI